jgi:hypothetical protein
MEAMSSSMAKKNFLDDYNVIEETGYLLRSPANAKNLRKSIKQ